MSIVLQSSGGGSVTVSEPSTASNFTQTLPAATGTVMVSGNMPTFSAYNSSQSITANTATKLQCNTEQWDTNSNYDSSTNYRFTPTIAGYYSIFAQVQAVSANATANISIYKNGSSWIRLQASFPSSVDTVSGTALVYFNGSTDYVEAYTAWNANNTVSSIFQGYMVRTA